MKITIQVVPMPVTNDELLENYSHRVAVFLGDGSDPATMLFGRYCESPEDALDFAAGHLTRNCLKYIEAESSLDSVKELRKALSNMRQLVFEAHQGQCWEYSRDVTEDFEEQIKGIRDDACNICKDLLKGGQ